MSEASKMIVGSVELAAKSMAGLYDFNEALCDPKDEDLEVEVMDGLKGVSVHGMLVYDLATIVQHALIIYGAYISNTEDPMLANSLAIIQDTADHALDICGDDENDSEGVPLKLNDLSDDDKLLVSFAINQFGTGGHPVANPKNLKYFGSDYVKECLGKVSKNEKVKPSIRAKANVLMETLEG